MQWSEDSTGALLFWSGAAVTSIERVLREDLNFSPWDHLQPDLPESMTRQVDAVLALLALRNLLRAAEWSARDIDQRGGEARSFVDAFRSMLPELVNARDVLEHFDDYALGRGRLQRAAADPYRFEFVLVDGEPVVNVGRFAIQLRAARDACRWLTIRLLARIAPENGERAEALLDEILTSAEEE